MAYTATSVL